MEAFYVVHLQKLGWSNLILIGSLLVIAGMSGCTFAYFGVRSAFEAWQHRKAERLARDAWLAEQERTHRQRNDRERPAQTATIESEAPTPNRSA